MNRLIAALLVLASMTPIDVSAQAKFCVVTNLGTPSCRYNDIAACQDAARVQGGICSTNATLQARPRVRFDPGSAYIKGYSSGAEDGRRIRAAAAAAERNAVSRRHSPPPANFVENCRALVAMHDQTATNIYGIEKEADVTFGAGICMGYINGYISARRIAAENSGRTCTISETEVGVARQVAAISDASILRSTVGLPALLFVSRYWQCN